MGLFKNIIEQALVIENQEYYIDFKVKTLSNLLYNPLLLEDGSSTELSDQNVYNDSIHAVFGKIADKIFGEFDEKNHKFTKNESDYKELATHDESGDKYKYKFTNDLGDIEKYDPSGYEKMITNIKFVNDREANVKHSETTSESVVDIIESLWNTHSKKHMISEDETDDEKKIATYISTLENNIETKNYSELLSTILSSTNGIYTPSTNIKNQEIIDNLDEKKCEKIMNISKLIKHILDLGFESDYYTACTSINKNKPIFNTIDKSNIDNILTNMYDTYEEYIKEINHFINSPSYEYIEHMKEINQEKNYSLNYLIYLLLQQNPVTAGQFTYNEISKDIRRLNMREYIYDYIYKRKDMKQAPSTNNREPEKIYNKDKSIQDDAIKTLVNSTKLYILVSQQENKNDEIVSDNVVMVCVVSATADWKLASSLIQFKNFSNIDKSIFKSLSSSIIEEINKINKQNQNTNDEWRNEIKNNINKPSDIPINMLKNCIIDNNVMNKALKNLKNSPILYTKLMNLNNLLRNDNDIKSKLNDILINTNLSDIELEQVINLVYKWSQQEHSSAVKYIIQYILKKINDGINIDTIIELSPNNIYNDTNKELVSDDSNDITWGIVIDKIINNGISVNISPKNASEPEHHVFTSDSSKNSYDNEDSLY